MARLNFAIDVEAREAFEAGDPAALLDRLAGALSPPPNDLDAPVVLPMWAVEGALAIFHAHAGLNYQSVFKTKTAPAIAALAGSPKGGRHARWLNRWLDGVVARDRHSRVTELLQAGKTLKESIEIVAEDEGVDVRIDAVRASYRAVEKQRKAGVRAFLPRSMVFIRTE